MSKKQPAEPFRKVRKTKSNPSESFGALPYVSEKTAEHILTVRDVAKRFENAGVSRTERSITNWCQPNPQGMARLDCFFDTNEHKYFITPLSVDHAISEEQNKRKIQDQTAHSEPARNPSENPGNDSEPFGNQTDHFGNFPNTSETPGQSTPDNNNHDYERQTRLLQIDLKGKELYIGHLEKSNSKLVEDIKHTSNLLGKMEERVRQLEAPKSERVYETYEMSPPAEESTVANKPRDGEVVNMNRADTSEGPKSQTTELDQKEKPAAAEAENHQGRDNNDSEKPEEPLVNDVETL